MASVIVIIIVTAVVVVIYVAVRRFGGTKLVLQVTGDSMDTVDRTKLPSIVIYRYVFTMLYMYL